MTDNQTDFIGLQQLVSRMASMLARQQGVIDQLARQAQDNDQQLEAVITKVVKDEMASHLPKLIKTLHPNLAGFLSALNDGNGVDANQVAALLSDDDEISDQQFAQIMQNVRLAIHDVVEQQVVTILRNAIF